MQLRTNMEQLRNLQITQSLDIRAWPTGPGSAIRLPRPHPDLGESGRPFGVDWGVLFVACMWPVLMGCCCTRAGGCRGGRAAGASTGCSRVPGRCPGCPTSAGSEDLGEARGVCLSWGPLRLFRTCAVAHRHSGSTQWGSTGAPVAEQGELCCWGDRLQSELHRVSVGISKPKHTANTAARCKQAPVSPKTRSLRTAPHWLQRSCSGRPWPAANLSCHDAHDHIHRCQLTTRQAKERRHVSGILCPGCRCHDQYRQPCSPLGPCADDQPAEACQLRAARQSSCQLWTGCMLA